MLFLGIYLLIQFHSAHSGDQKGFQYFCSTPPFVSLCGFERCVFSFFARACLKRRLLLVFSYCIVGCLFGLILGAMEFFVNTSHTFFPYLWTPPPSLTHLFVCDAPLISSAHLFPYLLSFQGRRQARHSRKKAGKLILGNALHVSLPFLPSSSSSWGL